MEGSPFPRLTVFAQHAEAVREQPAMPMHDADARSEQHVVGDQYIDGPVDVPFATAVIEDAVRADEAMHAVSHAQVVQVVAPAHIERPRPVHEALLETEGLDEEGLPYVDVEQLRARDVARELLRSRLLAIAERRERRSAWEIAFILLAAAVTVLLITPPVVQILLAMHGVEA
jgi:hypothetical protein